MTTSAGVASRAGIRLWATIFTATVTAIFVVACGGVDASESTAHDGTPPSPQSTPQPAPAATDGAQEPVGDGAIMSDDDLCERAAPMLVVVERPFIGSDAHVAQFSALAEVAPESMLADITLLETHYRDHVSPADPDSQNFENLPADVQSAALALDSELRARC